jgi:hypothetical protein
LRSAPVTIDDAASAVQDEVFIEASERWLMDSIVLQLGQ